jgi:hypothetical protein
LRAVKSGKLWVAGVLALGAGAALVAVLYWKSPANRVRWSFTQLHTSLLRNRPQAAAVFVASRVAYEGKEMSPEEFLRTYPLDSQGDRIEASPCARAPEHWDVAFRARAYCFVLERDLWRLHAVAPAPCACR